MIVSRRFSITNFVIASSALCFQVFVLYPWHERLDVDFQELKKEHMRVLVAGEAQRRADLVSIQQELVKLRENKKSWFS